MQSPLIFSGFTIIIKYDTSIIGKVRLFTHSKDNAIHSKNSTLYCAYYHNLYMGGEECGHMTNGLPLNDWINEYNKPYSVIVHTSELYNANVCTITEEEYYSSIIETAFDKKCGNYEDFCHAKKIFIDEFCKNEASRLEEINKNEASCLEEIRTLAIQLAAIIMTYAKAIKR
jgi:hypothetical protein